MKISPVIIPHDMPPVIQGAFIPAYPTNYIRKRTKDIFVRNVRSFLEVEPEIKNFEKVCNDLLGIMNPFFSDYDIKEILPTTTALGMHKPGHTALDEIGYMGKDNDYTYSPDVVEAAFSYYAPFFAKSKNDQVSVSIPRGRNIGYFAPVGGLNREATDGLLVLCATVVEHFRSQGSSAKDMMEFLTRYHGPFYTIYGERYQHTGKKMPMKYREGWYSSTNFEPRVRAIYMDPKVLVMWLKPQVNFALHSILQTSYHTQTRPKIQTTVDKYIKAGWSSICPDFSKFDQRHGGKRGVQIINLIDRLLTHCGRNSKSGFAADCTFNLRIPLLVPSRGQMLMRTDGPILTSGMAATTVIGCIGNLLGLLQAVKEGFGISPASLISDLSSPNPSLITGHGYGDDGLLFFHSSLGNLKEVEEKLNRGYASAKLEVENEVTVKFLGYQYNKGQFEGSFDVGYPVGRFFQQQFFPERKKEYPFSLIGLVARLNLVHESKREGIFNMLKEKFWNLELLGPKFEFSERYAKVEALIPEVEKYSKKISQIDDIINIFAHGLSDASMIDFGEEDYLAKLLGLNSFDLTQPIDALTKDYVKNSRLIQGLTRLRDGDLFAYPAIISDFSYAFKLTHSHRDVIY